MGPIEEGPKISTLARMLDGDRHEATLRVLLEERVLVQVMCVRDHTVVEADLESVSVLEVLNPHRQPP